MLHGCLEGGSDLAEHFFLSVVCFHVGIRGLFPSQAAPELNRMLTPLNAVSENRDPNPGFK